MYKRQDLKTIVYSVNEKTLTKDDQVISAASCTTCLLYTSLDMSDKWVLSELARTAAEVTANLDKYELGLACLLYTS